MFLQVPLPHGCLSHSSMSEARMETTKERVLQSRASGHSAGLSAGRSPMHML